MINKQLTQMRLGMYQLLAKGFSYPKEDFFLALETGAYGEYMRQVSETLGLELDVQPFANSGGLSDVDMESEYLRSFELNMPEKSCSLYAGNYLPGAERGGVLLSIGKIFKQFEITPDPKLGEPADFLVSELEFMQFLVAKELQAVKQEVDFKPYCWAQGDFLRLHLARWIPEFRKMVDEMLKCSFYRNLTKVLDQFIHWEEAYAIRRMAEIGRAPGHPAKPT